MKHTRLNFGIFLIFGILIILSTIPTSAETDIVAKWEKIDVTVQPRKSVEMVLVYDPINDVVVSFGGSDGTYTDETMAYDPNTKEWTDLQPTGGPPNALIEYDMVYNPIDGNLILFGGTYTDPHTRYQNEVWAFDYVANTWTELVTTNAPSPRSDPSMVFDPVRDKILVFGGEVPGYTQLDELWEFDPRTNAWTELTPTVSPSARIGGSFIFDPRTNKTLLFSGYDRPKNTLVDDSYYYDYLTNTWIEIDLGSIAPSSIFGMLYDKTENTIIGIGGGDSHLALVRLDNSTAFPSWDSINAADIPSNRNGFKQIVYMDSHDTYLFYGGYWDPIYHTDTYELKLAGGNRADPTFTIPVTPTPTPTSAATSTTEESFYPLIGLVALIPLVFRSKKIIKL